jgi:hypothetical protein
MVLEEGRFDAFTEVERQVLDQALYRLSTELFSKLPDSIYNLVEAVALAAEFTPGESAERRSTLMQRVEELRAQLDALSPAEFEEQVHEIACELGRVLAGVAPGAPTFEGNLDDLPPGTMVVHHERGEAPHVSNGKGAK